MTDLVVIHPGAQHGIYGPLGDNLTAVEPPVWARIIAGYCRDAGHSVAIIDQEAEALGADDVIGRVAHHNPKLVCIAVFGHQPSASTQQMVAASQIATALAAKLDVPVIMVGGHIAALTRRTMREEPIDFACNGEGPVTVDELLRWLETGAPAIADVQGLAWRDKDGRIIVNRPAPLIEDMNLMRGSAWDLLPMERYRAHNWHCFDDLDRRAPYASIHTSLGCPYRCAFCCINAPFNSNRYRMRDPVAVVEEIKRLHEFWGVRSIKFVDEMFVLNEKHYTAIAEGLIAAGLGDKLNIWAYARVDTVRAGKLPLLRRAGFRWLALGIESASAYVRDGAYKRMREDDISAVVRSIQRADINVIGNYIFGLPDDTMESMEFTLRLAMDLNTEFANFYSAMAYPGSPLYDQAMSEGWTLPESWRGYSQHNDDCRPIDTKHIGAADVLRFRDEAFHRYFTNPEYLEMVKRKFGARALGHVQHMTTYKLQRKLLGDKPEAA